MSPQSQRRYFCFDGTVRSLKVGGEKLRNTFVIRETCKINWMTQCHHTKKKIRCTIRWADHRFWRTHQLPSDLQKKTNIVCINSVLKYFLTSSLDTPCTQEEIGLKTCSSRTGTNSRRTSLPKSTSKDSSRQNSFVFLAQVGPLNKKSTSNIRLTTRTRAYQDHRCEERTTHSVCGCRQLHA